MPEENRIAPFLGNNCVVCDLPDKHKRAISHLKRIKKVTQQIKTRLSDDLYLPGLSKQALKTHLFELKEGEKELLNFMRSASLVIEIERCSPDFQQKQPLAGIEIGRPICLN